MSDHGPDLKSFVRIVSGAFSMSIQLFILSPHHKYAFVNSYTEESLGRYSQSWQYARLDPCIATGKMSSSRLLKNDSTCNGEREGFVQERGEKWDEAARVQLCYEFKTFLLAGHETSAAMLTWALFELSQHPEKRARVSA